jgi:hypothetical protein
MSVQTFKSVYFADFSNGEHSRKTFKLAFSPKDDALFGSIQALSSLELREALGHQSYESLSAAARTDDLAVNTYCLRTLRIWNDRKLTKQAKLPGFENFGLQGSFRNGKHVPLHRWYPYLEGYSPEFVQRITKSYAPTATRILDPFGGVGTTPITASLLGLDAFYCELNPLLQFLAATKIAALGFKARERAIVAHGLRNLSENWEALVAESEPDIKLDRSYMAVFGDSSFFPEKVYTRILRARTALDRVRCENPAIAQFVTVAVIGSLVPSSNLCRAGDLRFRRGTETQSIGDFVTLTQRSIQMIADDIEGAQQISRVPLLISEDAKCIHLVPDLRIEAVITSPPYLNGTNYFRNTKPELWFLRALKGQADLAAYRDRAVTAGINDVRGSKPVCTNPDVMAIVRSLESASYDSRIPKMVASYFHDIEKVLAGLKCHLEPAATVAIDIGDSTYAGIHVPTDVLIAKLAERSGLELVDSVLLRKRVSRDTTKLKQVLLVFRNRAKSRVVNGIGGADWNDRWEQFKKTLPHQQHPLSKRNWGHPLHSLCSYQGKMKPSLASKLIEVFLSEGGRLLDPFAGVGTIPFEAGLKGITSFAFDISPAALAISKAKLGRPDSVKVAKVMTRLADFMACNRITRPELNDAEKISFNRELKEYFHPDTFKEVLLARRFFRENVPKDASEFLVLASLLHILHGNRPYALSRRSHPITPFAPSGPHKYKELIANLADKLQRGLSAELPAGFREGEAMDCDATSCWPHHIEGLDAIITSPPFFDSTRFYLANWMRLWFAGWDREDFDVRPRSFIDHLQKQSFSVYESIFRQGRQRLKLGGVFVLHLGLSSKCNMLAELESIASPWFRVADRFSEDVKHCESHGVRDKGAVTRHQYLVLQ